MWKRFVMWVAGKSGLKLQQVVLFREREDHVIVFDDPYSEALYHAFVHCGVSLDLFKPEADLVHTGKVYDLLIHASRRIDKNTELKTTQDLIDWLRESPRA